MYKEITFIKKSVRCVLPKWNNPSYTLVNTFCEKIVKEAERYVKSEDFPMGAVYTVRYDKSKIEESELVIYLSLRRVTGEISRKTVKAQIRHGMISRMSVYTGAKEPEDKSTS